jgi:hypothetical protein
LSPSAHLDGPMVGTFRSGAANFHETLAAEQAPTVT